MSESLQFPKLTKDGIVLLDSSRTSVLRVIAPQYDPASLRSLQAHVEHFPMFISDGIQFTTSFCKEQPL